MPIHAVVSERDGIGAAMIERRVSDRRQHTIRNIGRSRELKKVTARLMYVIDRTSLSRHPVTTIFGNYLNGHILLAAKAYFQDTCNLWADL